MSPDAPQILQVPLSWVGYDEVPILYANHFLIQFTPEESFMVGVGQAAPPALVGTPEQIKAQAEQIEYVPVRTLARIGLTPSKVKELIAALEAGLRNFERTSEQIDPRSHT